ncbi:MAG TPA: hypothetical protein VN231_00210 [Allosphingosinicella sp.]|nr:hypothetical protein [Allosphingosinicella sp.]
MASRRTIEHIAPWLGMVGAAVGWFASHQAGSNAVFDDCRTGEGWFVMVVCLVGLALALAGGCYSWDIWRQGEKESEGRRFIGLLGAFLAALAAFAIVLQAVSALIIPRCVA